MSWAWQPLPAIPAAAGGNKSIAADGGSYAITGTAALLEFGFEVAADGGSYAVTGAAASLEYGREVAADGGTYILSGGTASLERGFEVVAGGGSYTITGTDVTLTLSGAPPVASNDDDRIFSRARLGMGIG